jgi:hypothetical protein|tara:strand:- start:2587 stop:3081 length:495 start_codon:yes stop_codon:yes gene_type:complete
MIDKLTNYASIVGVVCGIGGGFYAWGEFNTRLNAIENKEFVVNETVDLAPVNEKISTLEVEILDRMSDLEDEWMNRDNNSTDVILNDIAGINSDLKNLIRDMNDADQQLQLNIVNTSEDTFKEFGKIRDMINDMNKLIAIVQKENELQTILIDEIKAENSNPLK